MKDLELLIIFDNGVTCLMWNRRPPPSRTPSGYIAGNTLYVLKKEKKIRIYKTEVLS